MDVDVRAYRNLTAGMNGGVEWDAVSFSGFGRFYMCVTEANYVVVGTESTEPEDQHYAKRTVPRLREGASCGYQFFLLVPKLSLLS